MAAARDSDVRWIWAFIDRPRERFHQAARFWARASGTALSPTRGEHDQFATFLPPRGDAYLKLQGVFEGGGAHLDFAVARLAETTDQAIGLGATLGLREEGLAVLRSPAGQPFCLTDWDGQSQWPAPVATPSGALTRVDQVCLDLAPEAFAAESAFWSALTGWRVRPTDEPEFSRLLTPARFPLRVLLQRRDEPGPAAAHIDIACADVAAVHAWHEELGARYVARGRSWTVMRDPAGGVYCLTERSPEAGPPSPAGPIG